MGRGTEEARHRGGRSGFSPIPFATSSLSCPGRSSSRGGRQAFEESPDITGQGGRDIDPGKPAGKCHRNKPPMSAVPRERPAGKGEMVR
jgi:hypothetical protein